MDIKLLERFSLVAPEEAREAAIQEVLNHYNDYDLKDFIIPGREKGYWTGCAMLLARLPEDVFISLLPDVLEWMKDCNWPGAWEIEVRTKQLPKETIKLACKKVYEKALKEKDDEWIYNLKMVFGDDIFN